MKVLDFLFAARPMLHQPVWVVYLVTLHYSGHRFFPEDVYRNVILLVAMALLFSAGYMFNQVHDYDSDRRNNKLGFLQRKMLSRGTFKAAFWSMSVVAVGLGTLAGLYETIILTGAFVFSYAYSGPPFRLKDRPFGGFLANAFVYGVLVSLAGKPVSFDSGLKLADVIMPIYFFLSTGATYLVTTLPDIEGDRATGKRTIGVCIGKRSTLAVAGVLMLGAACFALLYDYRFLTVIALVGALMSMVAAISLSDRFILATAKVPLALLTVLTGYFYPPYLLFIVALIIITRIYYRRRFDVIYPRLA